MSSSKDEFIKDFRLRCYKVRDIHPNLLGFVKERVEAKECPFVDFRLERDPLFRAARRYYREHIENGISEELFTIIEEIKNE